MFQRKLKITLLHVTYRKAWPLSLHLQIVCSAQLPTRGSMPGMKLCTWKSLRYAFSDMLMRGRNSTTPTPHCTCDIWRILNPLGLAGDQNGNTREAISLTHCTTTETPTKFYIPGKGEEIISTKTFWGIKRSQNYS